MPLNDIWNTWAESGNDTEEPTHRIGNNRLLTIKIETSKILRHKDDEELPHNIQVPKLWVTNFKKNVPITLFLQPQCRSGFFFFLI